MRDTKSLISLPLINFLTFKIVQLIVKMAHLK